MQGREWECSPAEGSNAEWSTADWCIIRWQRQPTDRLAPQPNCSFNPLKGRDVRWWHFLVCFRCLSLFCCTYNLVAVRFGSLCTSQVILCKDFTSQMMGSEDSLWNDLWCVNPFKCNGIRWFKVFSAILVVLGLRIGPNAHGLSAGRLRFSAVKVKLRSMLARILWPRGRPTDRYLATPTNDGIMWHRNFYSGLSRNN